MCLQDQEESDSEEYARKKVYRYHMHGLKAGLMQTRYLDSKAPIYECHKECKCGEWCPNRVVERGRKVALQIFRTKTTGWGE